MDEFENDDFCQSKFRRSAPTEAMKFFPPNFCHVPGVELSFRNPGNITNLHKKSRDIMPAWIVGVNMRCAKNFDFNKTLYMEWLMGNCTPSGFRFGGMLCRKDQKNITVNCFDFRLIAFRFHSFFYRKLNA